MTRRVEALAKQAETITPAEVDALVRLLEARVPLAARQPLQARGRPCGCSYLRAAGDDERDATTCGCCGRRVEMPF